MGLDMYAYKHKGEQFKANQNRVTWLFWLFFCLNTNHTASSMNANLQVDANFNGCVYCLLSK